MNRFFIDKDCETNLTNGLPYYASGIIESDYTEDGKGRPSGKDFTVIFIDPWGNIQREWRSVDSIRIIEADEYDFNLLKDSIGIKNIDITINNSTRSNK